MKLGLVLVASLVGCSTSVGGAEDAGSWHGDGGILDDAATDDAGVTPMPLPQNAHGVQIAPSGLIPSAALDVNGTLFVVGLTKSAMPSQNDAVLLRETAQTRTAQLTGGSENDQIYAIANNGTNVLAVGLTRSFLGTANQDQILLAFTSTASSAITIGRLFVAADEFVQPRTVGAHGTGWMLGGHHLTGARGFVAILTPNGGPVRATSFTVGGTSSGLLVRRVLSDGTHIYAVGHSTQNGLKTGFVVAFDQNLAVEWARRVTAPNIDVQVMDAALSGGTLRVIGNAAFDGISLDIDKLTGVVTANRTWQGTLFSSIARDGFAWWVAGRNGNGTIAGMLGPTSLDAVLLSDLALPSLSAQALVVRGPGVSVIGSRTAGTVEVPLNKTPLAACNNVGLGAPFTAPSIAGTAVADTATVDLRALPLTFAAPTPTTTNATVSTFSACN